MTVNSLADAGVGTLRDAISQVIASSDATNTINITATGTISLTSALPYLAKANAAGVNVAINGPGYASSLIVERAVGATTGFRIFDVGPNSDVAINRLTVSKGFFGSGTGIDQVGAGIRVDGRVTLTNCVITGNSTTAAGGGIYVTGSGRLTLSQTSVNANRADGDGGGIFVAKSTVNLLPDEVRINIRDRSGISGNTSDGQGGGIYVGSPADSRVDRVRVTDSRIVQNNAKLEGGGLYFEKVYYSATAMDAAIDRTDVLENRSREKNGGAIFTGAKVTATNSKFNGNFGALATGYAIAVDASVATNPLHLDSCQVQNNRHSPVGGGTSDPNSSAISTGTGTIHFVFCSVTGNDGHGVAGTVTSGGGNTVTNSLSTSTGWRPFPFDYVS